MSALTLKKVFFINALYVLNFGYKIVAFWRRILLK